MIENQKGGVMKKEYVIKGHNFLLRGATTGLRYFEETFKSASSARKKLSKIENFISSQKRDIKKMTVALSVKEDKYFNNSDTICWCYWDIIGLFKKTEDILKLKTE